MRKFQPRAHLLCKELSPGMIFRCEFYNVYCALRIDALSEYTAVHSFVHVGLDSIADS
jgi:hypothetical protein